MNTSSKQPAREQRIGNAEQRVAADQIDLVERQHRAAAACFQPFDDAPRIRVVRPRRIDQQHDPVGVGGAGPGGCDHGAVEAAARLENAGRIDEDQLRRASERDAEQSRARRLHFWRDDRQLMADELVQQGRFAGIRRPDQRDIAAARRFGASFTPPRVLTHRSNSRAVPPLRQGGRWFGGGAQHVILPLPHRGRVLGRAIVWCVKRDVRFGSGHGALWYRGG